MVDPSLFDFYRTSLTLAQRGLTRVLAEPLTVEEGVWYWAANEEEGEEIVKRRVKETGNDLKTFLRLHHDLVNLLENIEVAGKTEDHSMMLQRTDALTAALRTYDTFILTHNDRLSGSAYLGLPNEPPSFNPRNNRFEYQMFVLALERVTGILFHSDLRGLGFERIDEMVLPYTPRDPPTYGDPTYHGRFDFVRHELVDRFGLKLD